MFSWQLSEIFNNSFFKERKKAVLREKKHCYKQLGSDIYRKSTYASFFVTSSRFLYFSKELAQFIVTTGIYSFISRKKSLKVVNGILAVGFWRSLTCQNSDADISPLGRLNWLMPMQCSPKTFPFLSVFDGPTSILSDIVINLRKSHEIIFVTYFWKNKSTCKRCFWDVSETSRKRHLFWDKPRTS